MNQPRYDLILIKRLISAAFLPERYLSDGAFEASREFMDEYVCPAGLAYQYEDGEYDTDLPMPQLEERVSVILDSQGRLAPIHR